MTGYFESCRAKAESIAVERYPGSEVAREAFVAGWEARGRWVSEPVATEAGLAALPDGAVLLDRGRNLATVGTAWVGGDRVVWYEGWLSLSDAVRYGAPFTVLWVPENVT